MLRALLAATLLLACCATPASAAGPPVVGGGETTKEWPFMVYVELGRQEVDEQNQICGGTLIAPTWVLTAAHCILAPEQVQ